MVHEGLKNVLNGMSKASLAAGRDPGSVTLIAVSKTFGGDAIVPVIEAGQRIFGENRVQEARAKWPALRMRWPDLELHLIGPLQSNKAADAVQLFDAIHSIDRPRIAEAVSKEMSRQNKRLKLFVQVNTGNEPQKAGIAPGEVEGFLQTCRSSYGLAIEGLMCIPPVDADPKPHFDLLADMAKRAGLGSLSMGMSGDYVQAIACGATHVRIGSAIFGGRV